MSRPAFCRLSWHNLHHNVQWIRARAPRSKIIAMVKANAYGHGIRSVSRQVASWVDVLGVASLDEAAIIRHVGVDNPIFLAEGVFASHEWAQAAAWNCQVVIHHASQWTWLQQAGPSFHQPVMVWLKVNTGMNRLGFFPSDVLDLYDRLQPLPYVQKPVGLLMHFASSENGPDHPKNQQQQHIFRDLVGQIPGFCGPVSTGNSGALIHETCIDDDYVRPGFVLYGLSPVPQRSGRELGLRPVMTVGTRLISTYRVGANQSIGYGETFVCHQETPIGIAAIGYGDGYPWTAQSGTPVLVNGVTCSLAGRVSMDMIAINLSACPEAAVGDEVVLWGETLPCEIIAPFARTSPYALCTGLHHRVKHQWIDRPSASPL